MRCIDGCDILSGGSVERVYEYSEKDDGKIE